MPPPTLLSLLRSLTLSPTTISTSATTTTTRLLTTKTLFTPSTSSTSLLPKPTTTHHASLTSTRAFTTTTPLSAKGPKGGSGKGGKRPAKTISEQRIALIRYHMQHPLTPRPLRFSRLRALRHWTIHRAWMLSRRNKLEREEAELMRMHQSMHAACEELRLLDSAKPQTKDSGRLYRIAMEKKGVFGHGGVPIEYARFQVDTPGKEAWNHGWTR